MRQHIDALLLAAFLLFIFVTRIWGYADVKEYVFDEGAHVPSATSYVTSGHVTPEQFWIHPPFRLILIYASMQMIGHTPSGWRFPSMLTGILTIVIVFLVCGSIFPDKRIAYLASALLAVDPLHIYIARTTSPEVVAGAFFMLAVFAAIRYLEKSSYHYLFAAGTSLGLALSEKWYFIPASFALLIFMIQDSVKKNEHNVAKICFIVSVMVLLPFAIYLSSFYAWFGRGYSFSEFIQMQRAAYNTFQGYTADIYVQELAYSTSALEWFTKPVIIGSKIFSADGMSTYRVLVSNFPFWMLAIPSFVYVGYRAFYDKSRTLFLIIVLFAMLYLQFLLIVKRPVFLYSALPGLPILYSAVAFSIIAVLNKLNGSIWLYRGILFTVLVWGTYLYPLAVGKSVPDVLYAPLTALGRISGL